jgi:uncharacterized protein (DUF1501 family)
MNTRRKFLQRSALVSLSPWIPAILPHSLQAAESKKDDRILVVVQLDGGNDGLNTVIPFADENYAKYRPELGIPKQDVLKLTDAVGLHPAMKPAAKLIQDGRLAIVQGVGYPNPDRSHFRSMAIWQHARLAEREHDSIGWLGRAAETIHSIDAAAPDSIYVGEDAIPVALRGRRANTVSIVREDDLTLASPFAARHFGSDADELSAYVTRTLTRSFDVARQFQDAETVDSGDSLQYPNSKLAEQLRLAARLIKLNGGTRVYYVSHAGYDTHAYQSNTHRQLLREFSEALQAFLNDLRKSQLDERVVVLAFSEFGRRVQENGSAGTDHGAAGPVFLAGSAVRSGFIGEHPSLTDLDAGDLKMSIDFRHIYATLLDEWLSIPSINVLNISFDRLQLIKS